MARKYRILPTTRFKRDLKRAQSRGMPLDLLDAAIDRLQNGERLPDRFRDHPLAGAFRGCRECHILPDWLLIYEIVEENLVLYLMRTGTHRDLFE